MKNTPFDIILWKTFQEGHQDDSSRKDFEFYFQNQKVGKCSIRLCQNAYAIYGEKQFFPDSWFYEDEQICNPVGRQALLRPFLEITDFDFRNFQGKGFGRTGLQMMYHLARKLGAKGRISLIAQKRSPSLCDPTPFYEHCGFEGNENNSGRKYFDPNPQNIAILFSKKNFQFFKMKEIAVKENKNFIIDRHTGQVRIPEALKEFLERQKN